VKVVSARHACDNSRRVTVLDCQGNDFIKFGSQSNTETLHGPHGTQPTMTGGFPTPPEEIAIDVYKLMP
jgi:hypothetical protein